jgi:hypothetical protein
MGMKKDSFIECVGTVTIVTVDRLIFQGQIVKEEKEEEKRHHDEEPIKVFAKLETEPEFIKLRLVCDPAIIKDNGEIEEIEPDLFEEGDVIRINENEIITIGPSRECLGEGGSAKPEVTITGV